MFFLCPTPLTATSARIEELAARVADDRDNYLERLHRLCNGVRDAVNYVPNQTHADTTAVEVFDARAGVCQDHAHVMIGAARSLGFPARYVSGYLFPIAAVAAASQTSGQRSSSPTLAGSDSTPPTGNRQTNATYASAAPATTATLPLCAAFVMADRRDAGSRSEDQRSRARVAVNLARLVKGEKR